MDASSGSSLLRLSEAVRVLPGPTNIGIILESVSPDGKTGVYLVDSGNDKEAGRKILRLLEENGWVLRGIVNTHSNADHIGANEYLQGKTGCGIWASRGESSFIQHPVIESSFLWGGYPFREIRSKFFLAKPSRVTGLLGEGIDHPDFSSIPLAGHYFDQVGILSRDGVAFLGDGIFGEEILSKYGIPYIYDVREFRASLGRIRALEASHYVPSHGGIIDDRAELGRLVDANLRVSLEVEESIVAILKKKQGFEGILKSLCDGYSVTLGHAQYILIGNTLRSFLSYLSDEGKARFSFEDNVMYWEGV